MKRQEITCIVPKKVELSEIETGEGPYTMSYGFDVTDLKKSISEIGLIHPPILVKTNNKRIMDIVAGYRRIMALKSLGEKRVFVIDLSLYNFSPLNLLLLNLYDNLMIRKLNPVEIGMLIKRLSLYISMDDIGRKYLPLLGITKHQDPDVYLQLSQADKQLKDSVSNNKVSIKAATFLLNKDSKSRQKVLDLISNLNININYQLQLIDLLEDIATRDGLLISEIFDDDGCRQILEDKNLNQPQMVKKLSQYLRSRRYPRLSKSEENFKKNIYGLKLPPKVNINHPSFFEAQDYLMEIFFKDGKELHEKLLFLNNIDGLKKIKDPWVNGENEK